MGEPGPSSEAPAYKNAQVWKDLENETGFASCADYLEFYLEIRPDFEDRLKQFREMPEDLATAEKDWGLKTSIAIYDLSDKESFSVCQSFRRHCHSGTELIEALREPPANVCVQLVVWSCWCFFPNQEMADALVLGLKLDPQLLEDASHIHEDQYPRKGFRTSQIKYVIGNGTVAVLSPDFMPEGKNTVPVLLIAYQNAKFPGEGTIGDFLAVGDYWKPPVRRSAPGGMSFREMGNDGLEKIGRSYARSVQQFIFQGRSATPSKAFSLLAAMSPLLDIEAYRLREASMLLRDIYAELSRWKISGPESYYKDLSKDLYVQRFKLRRTLEEAGSHASQLFSYLGSRVALDWSKENSYASLQADLRSLTDEARRLETEVRDYMQLQVGNLSLEESRRSIELANLQIRESKSGRLEQQILYKLTLTCCSENLSVQGGVSGRLTILTMFQTQYLLLYTCLSTLRPLYLV